MSEKKIFINPQAPSVATALVSGFGGNPTNFPELFFGDAYEFVVKFTGDSDDGFIVPPADSFVFNLGLLARASAGTFVLEFDGLQTAPLPFDASAEDVANALNELETMQNVGGCEVTGLGGSPYRIIFKNYGGRSKIGIQSSLFPDVAPISYVVEAGSENARAEQLIILKLDYVASVTDYVIDANAKELRFKVSLNTVECLLALGQADKVKLIAELKGISASGDVQTFVQIPATIYNRLIDVSALEYTIVELAGVVAQANAILEQFRSESAGITESIKTLSQVKSNRGELWFNNTTDKIACSNKWTNAPFSCVMTFVMTLAEANTSITAYSTIGTCSYSSNQNGFFVAITKQSEGDIRLLCRFYSNGENEKVEPFFYIDKFSNWCDGEHHTLLFLKKETSIEVWIDSVMVKQVAVAKSTPKECSQAFYVTRCVGRFSRIKYFNFDITNSDAPYTLADYINGKDESPMLKNNQPLIDWHSNPTGLVVGTTNITLTNTATIQPYPFAIGTLKAGNTYRIRIQGAVTCPSGQAMRLYLPITEYTMYRTNVATGEVTDNSAKQSVIYVFKSDGAEWISDIEFTATADSTNSNTYMRIDAVDTSATNSFTMTAQTDGVLLSLADYSIQRNSTTKVVLDESGNGNIATITGDVAGTNDTAISAFIDELKMQITQTS